MKAAPVNNKNIVHLPPVFVGLVVVCLLVLTLVGCNQQEKLARQIQQSRQKSYQALTHSPQQEEKKSDWETISGPLSLDECVELALLHNKDVQAAKLKLLEAKGEMTTAISTALPSANFTGTAQRNDNSGFSTIRETYELQVLVKQPLYLGGVIGAALDAARVFTYQTQQTLRQAIQAVQFQIRQSYLDALLARQLVEVSLQARRDARKLLEDTQKRLRSGVSTRFDVLRAEVRLNAVQAELIQTQNDARLALTRLLDVMGVSQTSTVELTGDLQYNCLDIDSTQCLSIAMTQRPDLLIAEAMIRLRADQVKSELSGDRPRVYLQGMYMRSYPGFAANFSDFSLGSEEDGGSGSSLSAFDSGKIWERTMFGGLLVEWPFFDGFATHGRVVKARSLLRQQQVALRKLEQQTQFEITQALLNLQSSRESVLARLSNITNAEEALRLAQVSYREGTATSLDVISSELALAQARSDYHRSVHSYQLSLLQLHIALGTLGEQPVPAITDDAEPPQQQNTDSDITPRGKSSAARGSESRQTRTTTR